MRYRSQREKVSPEQVETGLRMAYLRTKSEPNSRILSSFTSLLGHFQREPIILPSLMQEAADTVRTLFKLRYVMIGLRSLDGQYRYEYMSGMREDTWAAHRKKVYTLESFSASVPGWYSAGEISEWSRVYLEEKNPLGPGYEDSVNRPALLSRERTSIDTSLEADFFNALIVGQRRELLGWIEYSGTVGGKLPDAMAIRSIEVVASILSAAITSQDWKRRGL